MKKTWKKSILAAVFLTLLFTLTGFAQNCENISDKVLRLHVLANSDSGEDQSLKLEVRDELLRVSEEIFAGADSLPEAKKLTEEHLALLQEAAQREVYRRGYRYPVKAELVDMYFTTRQYDSVTLPAGKYSALRVTIGSGEGHNWWCVMFPPMCLPAAEERQELEDVLTSPELEIVENTPQFEIRFKVVEWFEGLRGWIESW